MIVDSGTTAMFLPTYLANQINKAFNPPAICDNGGNCYVSCNAVAPQLTFRIGTSSIPINPVDLVLDNVVFSADDPEENYLPDNWNRVCSSGVSPSGPSSFYVLGDVFLKNVVAVFDVGASQMRFGVRSS
jgi:hypothetical protein